MKKNVLITGASGGIGACLAKSFALAGYGVLIHYNNNENAADELHKLLSTNGCKCSLVKADLTVDDDIRRLAKTALASKIDVLINNAGLSHTALFTDHSFIDISNTINANLTGAIKLTSLITPMMVSRKQGCIINISSIWGECGASLEVVYSAAKAGIIGFTKALAKELAPSGIRVNCISPGIIRTNMLKEHSTATLSSLREQTPLSRLGEGSDIANGALFLASSKADFITGEVLKINGGFLI